MKKYLKIFVLITVLLLVSSMLSSCGLLEELKELRVELADDGNLKYKGNVYKKLEYDYTQYSLTFYPTYNLNLVDKEVPLLLTDHYRFARSVRYDKNTDLILCEEGSFYCREDKFESYKKAFSNAEFDCLRVGYYDYNDFENKYKILDKKLTDAIEDVLSTVSGEKVPDGFNYNYIAFSLDACDENNLFYIGNVLDVVVDESKGYYGIIRYEADFGNEVLREVPDKYKGIFSDFYKEFSKLTKWDSPDILEVDYRII